MACLDSASRELTERRVDLAELVDDKIAAVVAHATGVRIHFCSGAAIHVDRGSIFDLAGNPVIEPVRPAPERSSPLPGQPAAAPASVHAVGGGNFGDPR